MAAIAGALAASFSVTAGQAGAFKRGHLKCPRSGERPRRMRGPGARPPWRASGTAQLLTSQIPPDRAPPPKCPRRSLGGEEPCYVYRVLPATPVEPPIAMPPSPTAPSSPSPAAAGAPLIWTNIILFSLTFLGCRGARPLVRSDASPFPDGLGALRRLPHRQRNVHHRRLSPAVGAPHVRRPLEPAPAVRDLRLDGAAEHRLGVVQRPSPASPQRR